MLRVCIGVYIVSVVMRRVISRSGVVKFHEPLYSCFTLLYLCVVNQATTFHWPTRSSCCCGYTGCRPLRLKFLLSSPGFMRHQWRLATFYRSAARI